ncbi:MAG: hypothetical protein HRT71_14910 [Flavobacteriales bacterium]|nr:hypothetical protein [Flavobacteriales bacterium]
MENPISESNNCNCTEHAHIRKSEANKAKVKKTVKTFSSTALSVLIAFFPKCPLCWAAYMSMFGSFGLSNIPFMKWILPVLICFLGLHIFLLVRKIKENGYGPIICSVAGGMAIVSEKVFFPFNTSILVTGMALLLIGSLWNNFSMKVYQTA